MPRIRPARGASRIPPRPGGIFLDVAGGWIYWNDIGRLGPRWGIRNENLFRQTMAALLEQSFGVRVEQRSIAGEQFHVY